MLTGYLSSETVSYSIVIINFLLRSVNMFFISYIGYYTESELTTRVQKSVFYTQFFNTAILLLLTNINVNKIPAYVPMATATAGDLSVYW
mmetsp:Transcript_39253/g.37669  ORF Transcript_39253/g.37669 Transcript_39253/m.37669 type:complete len:90 (-) Transcript_39253:740-1009(-)